MCEKRDTLSWWSLRPMVKEIWIPFKWWQNFAEFEAKILNGQPLSNPDYVSGTVQSPLTYKPM